MKKEKKWTEKENKTEERDKEKKRKRIEKEHEKRKFSYPFPFADILDLHRYRRRNHVLDQRARRLTERSIHHSTRSHGDFAAVSSSSDLLEYSKDDKHEKWSLFHEMRVEKIKRLRSSIFLQDVTRAIKARLSLSEESKIRVRKNTHYPGDIKFWR